MVLNSENVLIYAQIIINLCEVRCASVIGIHRSFALKK
jgi:hypothetical protein